MPDLAAKNQLERELHDKLRGEGRYDPRLTANKKFYSITDSSKRFVRDWLGERCAGKRVLDYCCGDGSMALAIASMGGEAVGIDISPVSVENAERAASAMGLREQAMFRVMDAENLLFGDETFDYAVVHGVLHHLDLEKAYAELSRVLRPQGEVICTEALRHNPLIHLYRRRTPHLRSQWELKHILGKGEIERARMHFDSVRVLRFCHLAEIAAIPFRNRSWFGALRKLLQAIDAVLLRLPIIRWQAWMAVFVLGHPRKMGKV